MNIEFDPVKQQKTWQERGLDFARSVDVFAAKHFNAPDTRQDYGEPRFITIGALDGRLVVLVWTPRPNARRIISMRKANERECSRFSQYLE